MTRNMVDVNIELFGRLKRWLPADYRQSDGVVKRYISTSKSEKNWLQNVSFSTDSDLAFSMQQQVCVAKLESDSYLLCIGFKPDFSSEEFVYQESNAGLFCAAVVALNLEPTAVTNMGYELAEKIFYPVDINISTTVAYEWEIISEFFPKFYLFKIPSGSPFLALEELSTRVGLFALARTASLRPLLWSSSALEIVQEICSTENKHFPINLVLHAILERKWEHAFLDIYRCVEFLFPFPKANELKRALQLETTTSDVSYQIESVLGWRQQEDVALSTLFSKLPPEQLNLIEQALGITPEEVSAAKDTWKFVAKRIYKLRNDCVHYRPVQSRSQLKTAVNWPVLVQELLRAASFFHRAETSL